MKIVINGEMVDIPAGQNGIPTVPLTQAEYDALTDDEKNAEKLYLITDAAASGSDSGGSSENVYSTEETRIGTWIDGKPLYRKVFTFSDPGGTADTEVDAINLSENGIEADTLKRIEGYVLNYRGGSINDAGIAYPIPRYWMYGSAQYVSFYIRASYANRFITLQRNASTSGVYYMFICEYTKTTDTATGGAS